MEGNGDAVSTTRIRTLAHKLGKPFDHGTKAVSDAELLTRFLDSRDEMAFEELVGRHLSSVRAVCRSVLRDPNDVDDAAQATFLVFVRRVAVIREKLALGAWLCRVAWRTANRLRELNARRTEKVIPGIDPDTTPSRQPSASGSSEVATAVDDEIRRLPERYRMAVLTYYAAGLTTAEAASRLGWAKGTLLTRLAWARRRLRDRLSKRGVTLSGSFMAVLASKSSRAAEAILVCRIVMAGMAVATGDPIAKELVSERVSTLMEGTVRAMIATKMKLALGIGFVIVALLGLGLGRLTLGAADAAPGDKKISSGNVETEPATGKNQQGQKTETVKTEHAATVPGNDLIVRRPLGSYTREVAPFGKATVTFTENRIHVLVTVRIDDLAFSLTADADYTINRESMVYGIVTGVDVSGEFDEDKAAEIMAIAAAVNDIPFAFRVRVEDDAIMVKDIKCGPLGSPIFAELISGAKDKEDSLIITGIIGGKYKVDPNPERNPSLPPVKSKKK